MIKLTLYNDSDLIVNADLIEFIEHTPDTLISLTTGKKLMVKEPVDDVVRKVVAYRRRVTSDHGLRGKRAAGLRVVSHLTAGLHGGHSPRISDPAEKGGDSWTSRPS